MAKLRLAITKGEEIRYISHLDYSRTMERAIRRANMPVAYSEGFNPHMKVAYASALAVGVTSEAEYADVELTEEVPVDRFVSELSHQLPAGIELKQACYMGTKTAALMAVVNLAIYEITVPLTEGALPAAAETSISRFNDDNSVIYVKETPKGRREINIKDFLPEKITMAVVDGKIMLNLTIKITPTGSIKPGEVLAALVSQYDFPVELDAVLSHRTGLFVADGNARLTPLEL